ncbi:hypothetical protein SPRG_05312 [Saprolegnia parasitica CBS 223.65]|uniref:Uncharacterized protein n=1 Tax=Saprolegnia parasitica (strain CBS 223.65) TaxID=695850 RepID=A0A067CLN2_SAPPC|nr:hypothetical protein SPRG_05312 [Saprolegnia parasitica CBS 223.65]KDO30120.1 hypothetical protein SPRG_05312 [Saprolegnia parasitica CBS 223.65]|eukprot:XP_012199299.1 hypothetical protein SPRG_05312 [Saprolegnia parasitica CBS 223.65]
MSEFDICLPPSPLLKLHPPAPPSPPNGQPNVLLGAALLRKSKPLVLFENLGTDALVFKPPTTKMRFIDTLRYHKPTLDERTTYNLAGSTERLNLHTLNDVLAVCRARRGMRFKSQDICRIRAITSELQLSYDGLNVLFKALPAGVNRIKVPVEPPAIRSPPSVESDDDKAVVKAAVAFHERANAYVATFLRLRSLVETIQASQGPLQDVVDDVSPETDSEFESKAKAPFPMFLFVLIQKYRRERHEMPSTALLASSTLPTHPWWPNDAHPPLDSLAAFAIFLASSLIYGVSFHKDELEAIAILLQIIKCDHAASTQNLRVELLGDCTERTLRLAIFEFLATVRELRAIPKQAELLQKKRKVATQ